MIICTYGHVCRAKRNSIRATWKARVLREFPNVHVRFVLAQPATPVDERDMKASSICDDHTYIRARAWA